MAEREIAVRDGPDKPALQWALLYPERGQSVIFRTESDMLEAQISEMEEVGNGFSFNLWGTVASGPLQGAPFHGFYSVESRSGALILER